MNQVNIPENLKLIFNDDNKNDLLVNSTKKVELRKLNRKRLLLLIELNKLRNEKHRYIKNFNNLYQYHSEKFLTLKDTLQSEYNVIRESIKNVHSELKKNKTSRIRLNSEIIKIAQTIS